MVIYASATGNTAAVARAIAGALGIEARDVRSLPPGALRGVRFLFVGDGVYFLRPSRAMVRFLRAAPDLAGAKAAVFGTYGARPTQLPVLERLLREKGAEIVGRFACPGPDRLTLGLVWRGRPNESDLERARAFAREAAREAGYRPPESSA